MNQKTAQDFAHIPGWGVDVDPKNDPTYPMKRRTDAEQSGYSWERPPLQMPDVEILHSNERPNLPAVFGVSTPPSGLSGLIRRFAFRYSENQYRHWLPLLLADRVNVVEGIVDDLLHGHVPNIWAEKGYRAEWKHNPKMLATKLAVTALGLAGIVALIATRGGKQPSGVASSRRGRRG